VEGLAQGPYYEAARARSWAEFEEKLLYLIDAWATKALSCRRMFRYEDRSLLSAYKGELSDCFRMRKRV
jgi:hypothetical protein